MQLSLEGELEFITDLPTLLAKRSARKGTVMRLHHDLGLTHACPLQTLDTYDIQCKLDTVLKNQEKFELIQVRVEVVASPEELHADEAVLTDQHSGIGFVRKMLETTLKANECLFVEDVCLRTLKSSQEEQTCQTLKFSLC